MELMRQCPNCGKAVAADRTYCMHCGTTLGIKCEACGKVVPLQTKVCTCGHSFVKRTKKVRSGKKLLPSIKQRAKPILLCAMALVILLTVIFAALPSVGFRVGRLKGTEFVEDDTFLSGFSLIGFFLGGHPGNADALLSNDIFEDAATPMRLWMYLEGFAWLVLLLTLLLLVLLVLPNAKRMGQGTARRMIPLTAIVAGSGAVLFGADTAIRAVMTPLAQEIYPIIPGVPLDETSTRWTVGSAFPLVILILVCLFFALHMTFYLWVYKKVEEPEAKSLKVIFKTPFVAFGNALRNRPRRKGKKKKHVSKKRADDDEKSIVCTPRFTTYLILLGVSLIFTQALLSKISNIFFWFMFILPLPSLVYTLIAKASLHVKMISDSATTEKNQPYTYEFEIDNRSVLAFPFIDAKVSIPQSNSVRCTDRSVRLSMAPMSSYHMKNTVRFRFRGTYEIGVRCFYVYDFFRMFRVRVPVANMTTVYVLPRRLGLEDTLAQAVSDSTTRTVRSPLVVDRLEVSDIRDYQNGDSLKSIHWKLSSKSETFIVKDYNTGTSNQTVIFCDMAGHFPDEPPKSMTESEAPTETPKRKLTPEEKAAARAESKAKKAAGKKGKKQPAAENKAEDVSDENAARVSADTQDELKSKAPEKPAQVYDVHRLAKPVHYEDMNEYLADGVVELTVASVLAELRQGHEVTLLWFDHRSDAGLYAFAVRGISEFESIYHLFATAPLCDSNKRVCNLTAMISDIQSTKQLFVTSTMDQSMISELAALPGVSDAGNFGSAEVILYNPEDRFLYPAERASYLEGCRETLLANGLSLRTSGMIAVRQEGGGEA